MKYLLSIITPFIFISVLSAQVYEPEFTTIDKLAEVNLGMSEEKVTEILGIPPYDVYHDVANNCKVLVWHYKHKGHIISSNNNNKSQSLSSGQTVFFKPNKVYFKFSENDRRLLSYFTEEGQKRSIELIELGRKMQLVCDDNSKLKLSQNKSDKILIRSFNNSRFGAFFKYGLDQNPDSKNDILLGFQYRNIFMPFVNTKSISLDAKLLYNFTAKVLNPDDNFDDDPYESTYDWWQIGDQDKFWRDHLIVSMPVHVCYNWRSFSLGAGVHLGFGNEGVGPDAISGEELNNPTLENNIEIIQGQKEGYDNFLAVPVLKIGYNLLDRFNIEYNMDLSNKSQTSIGIGYYFGF